MEKLQQLVPVKSWSKEMNKLLHYNSYSYATNSFYVVRKRTDAESEEGLGKACEATFNSEKNMIGEISLDIFNGYDTISTLKNCPECNGKGEVQREYGEYSNMDNCPVCDGNATSGGDPLDNVYIKIGNITLCARDLHTILSVIGNLRYGTTGGNFYAINEEYECIMKSIEPSKKAQIIELGIK